MNKEYKFLIFDWDGTLAKTPEVISGAYKEVLIKRGLFLSDEHYKRFMMGNWINGLKRYGVSDPEAAIDSILKSFSQKMKGVGLYSGVGQTLQKLRKKGKKMALLTTTPAEYLQKALAVKEIIGYFDAVLTEEDVGSNKLNLFVLESCLKRLSAKKKNTIFVGNTRNDAAIGKEFGVTTIIFYPKENEKFYSRKEILAEKPDYVVREFNELLKLIK